MHINMVFTQSNIESVSLSDNFIAVSMYHVTENAHTCIHVHTVMNRKDIAQYAHKYDIYTT